MLLLLPQSNLLALLLALLSAALPELLLVRCLRTLPCEVDGTVLKRYIE